MGNDTYRILFSYGFDCISNVAIENLGLEERCELEFYEILGIEREN